jgi:hypothetical protein
MPGDTAPWSRHLGAHYSSEGEGPRVSYSILLFVTPSRRVVPHTLHMGSVADGERDLQPTRDHKMSSWCSDVHGWGAL